MGLEISHMTISKHLIIYRYKKSLLRPTPMLTVTHKQKRVKWMQKHINNDWSIMLFSDETSRGTILNKENSYTIQIFYTFYSTFLMLFAQPFSAIKRDKC